LINQSAEKFAELISLSESLGKIGSGIVSAINVIVGKEQVVEVKFCQPFHGREIVVAIHQKFRVDHTVVPGYACSFGREQGFLMRKVKTEHIPRMTRCCQNPDSIAILQFDQLVILQNPVHCKRFKSQILRDPGNVVEFFD